MAYVDTLCGHTADLCPPEGGELELGVSTELYRRSGTPGHNIRAKALTFLGEKEISLKTLGR